MIKHAALQLVLTGLLFSTQAPAEDLCNNNDTLALYREARSTELPQLDDLTVEQRDRVAEAFEWMLQATQEQAYIPHAESRIRIPALYNSWNVQTLLDAEENDDDGLALLGMAGVYADSIMTVLPPSELAKLEEELEARIEALESGAPSYAEYTDSKYRSEVSRVLVSEGCLSDLTNDYGLEPYSSSN